jgi:hypothetical protein
MFGVVITKSGAKDNMPFAKKKYFKKKTFAQVKFLINI